MDVTLNHAMLRIKDPAASLPFYRDVLGMTLLDSFDFPEAKFSLHFLGYPREPAPADRAERVQWIFEQPALLELTHNWGTESEPGRPYHDGNAEPRGYGHIGLSTPEVEALCARCDAHGVEFIKRPDSGRMKGIAFVKDPDGYWIEILSGPALRDLLTSAAA